MKDFIFSLGIIDKKLIWPFLFTIIQITQNIIDTHYPEDKKNETIYYFSSGIGQCLIILTPYIVGNKNLYQKKEKKCTKQNVLHYFLLLLFNGMYYGMIAFNSSVNGASTNVHKNSDYTKEIIEIIFITILTFLILKYKYFIHHIISLIMFCILSIGIDILLNNLKEKYSGQNTIQIVLEVLTILLQMLNYCYQKYMMEVLYHNYWTINFALGLFFSIVVFMIIIFNLIRGDKSFIDECKEKGIGYILLYLIFQAIVSFFLFLFRILILNYLTPNHLLIAYDLYKIFIILNGDNEKKWYSIILFIFQFISLAFFLEIFEFNFCGLNKNTKRNINKRAAGEELLEGSDSKSDLSSIDIEYKGEYNLKEEKIRNREFEMISISDELSNALNIDN